MEYRIEKFETPLQFENEFSSDFINCIASFKSQLKPSEELKQNFIEILNGLFEGNGFKLPHPFRHREKITSFNSCEFRWSRNLIIFKYDDDFLVVIQKYYFIDQLFFYNKKLLLLLNECFESEEKLAKEIQLLIEDGIAQEKFSSVSKELQLNLETNRPFHAFYPILGALCFIDKQNINIAETEYFTSNVSFLNFHDQFSWLVPQTQNTNSDVKFRVRIECWAFASYTDKDDAVFSNAINQDFRDIELKPLLDRSDKILWLDLNSEKRKLVNKIDIFKDVIKIVTEKYANDNIMIFCDGLTQPLQSKKPRVFENDLPDFLELKESFQHEQRLKFYHGSGLNPNEKMKIASHTFFFIADAGTASMYPDRFAKRKGITFKPNNWLAPGHIHYNSIAVSSTYITNLSDGAPVNCVFKIEPEVILSSVKELIK